MNSMDIKQLANYLRQYINIHNGDNDLKFLFELFQRVSNHQLTLENLKESLISLINTIEYNSKDACIVFIKNENNLYNLCYFKQQVKFKKSDLESMDNLIEKIKQCKYDGMILENLNTEDIVNFLKAYYLYREDVQESKTANNKVKEYSPRCLEMSSFEEKYESLKDDFEEELKNVILYSSELLPYSLEYLDDAKKEIHSINNSYFFKFSTIYREVCDNRYIGLSLKKFNGYWK